MSNVPEIVCTRKTIIMLQSLSGNNPVEQRGNHKLSRPLTFSSIARFVTSPVPCVSRFRIFQESNVPERVEGFFPVSNIVRNVVELDGNIFINKTLAVTCSMRYFVTRSYFRVCRKLHDAGRDVPSEGGLDPTALANLIKIKC